MEKTSILSLKTKKILTGIGIAFGTIVVFLVSFTLSFCLIINPISFSPISDSDAAKENKELREKVETLNDEIEHLNASVDKYKASAQNASIPVVTTPSVTTPSQSVSQSNTSSKTQTSSSAKADDISGETNIGIEDETESKFSPETVTGTAEETPEDIEAPITVIDISEN